MHDCLDCNTFDNFDGPYFFQTYVLETYSVRLCYMYKIKWQTNKYHIIGTVPKSDRKIVDRGKINTPDTIIHDRPLSMLGSGNSRKGGRD